MDKNLIAAHEVGNSRFELRAVPCGKKNCMRCPHGPYWYEFLRLRDGRIVKKYIGKVAPASVPASMADARDARVSVTFDANL